LLERIISIGSKEGDLVLDCFMGSGTTAVVSRRLNRNFIGFEIDKECIETANKRLEQCVLEQLSAPEKVQSEPKEEF